MSQKAFTTVGLLALVVAAPIFAETPLKANIPFNFTVGSTRMAAGEYTIMFDNPATVRVVREDGTSACVTITIPASTGKTPEVGKLVFNNYGGSFFLSQIWSPGYDQGRQLRKSKLELEVARNTGGVQLASIHAARR